MMRVSGNTLFHSLWLRNKASSNSRAIPVNAEAWAAILEQRERAKTAI